jgi:hypothetical protein
VTFSLAPAKKKWSLEVFSDGLLKLTVDDKAERFWLDRLPMEPQERRKLTAAFDSVFQLASSAEVLESKGDYNRSRAGYTHVMTIVIKGARDAVLRSVEMSHASSSDEPKPPKKLLDLAEQLEDFCTKALPDKIPKSVVLE